MDRRARCLAVILFLGTGAAFASTVSAPSAPDPLPQVTAAPCPFALTALPDNLPAAFAYDLESPQLLGFIAALAAVPERDQKRVFDTAVAAVDASPELDARAPLLADCPSSDEIYGSSRAMYLVVDRWTLGELANRKRFGEFTAAVRAAVAALARGDPLSPELPRAALAPFPVLAGFAPPTPAPSSPPSRSVADCRVADSPPKAIHLVEPKLPRLPSDAAATGEVVAKIALSWTGDVESVRLFSDTLHGRPGAKEVLQTTILALAASTYAPAIERCIAVGSELDFTEQYVFK
jgi:hypothetical protein